MIDSCVTLFKPLIRAGSDLLFPPSCPVCSQPLIESRRGLCEHCMQDVSLICSPLCRVCGKEMRNSAEGDHLCGICLHKTPFFTSARGVARYQDPVANLLHRLKYQTDYSVLPALQRIVVMMGPVAISEDDRIIPVPLHSRRLRFRGFNQSVLLAGLFFPNDQKLLLRNVLQRIRDTTPQTGLNGIVRRKNLKDAFAVHKPRMVRQRKIFLVDDVFTTGTTVSECSRVLLGAGAREVHVLTLARVNE